MTAPRLPLNEEDTSAWTHESVKYHVESSTKPLKAFYQNFFGWSAEEYKEALGHTVAEVRTHFDLTKKFPKTGPQAKLRHTVQVKLVRDRPDLFVNRHGLSPPAWFDTELISRPPKPSDTKFFDMKNVVQQFIAYSRGHETGRERQRTLGKRKNLAEGSADNDEANDNGHQVLNKRPQASWLGRTTPVPNQTSMFMPPSPHTTARYYQASVHTKPSTLSSNSGRGGRPYNPAATTPDVEKRASNTLSLILYVTCVTIVDQTLNLTRDRFALVDNLFEHGQLIEPRMQELVFGNPIDNKPTFLWFFDDISNDKPRSIKNRPSAEAAIAILGARAERSGATGIQLFDAPDRDTAALIPAQEVTRKDNFSEQVSFELEFNKENEDDYDDEDGDEEEAAKNTSRSDPASEFRDEELQRDDVAIKEEIDARPDITWAGQQQQENNVESDGESDEDEEIGRAYR